jgi:type II secretory pathway pseudopilin PulG
VRLRLRGEEGFGLLELMIALALLNVGLLAILAAFNSGALAIQRASETSTASVLADAQMELYRGVRYDAVGLNLGTATDSTYQADPACISPPGCSNLGPTAPEVCPNATFPNVCVPSRAVTGPDGVAYRVDTYIRSFTPQAGANAGRPVKRVTVVVRKASTLATLARLSSDFDSSTG